MWTIAISILAILALAVSIWVLLGVRRTQRSLEAAWAEIDDTKERVRGWE